jgi:hypothetical protein
MSEEDSTSAYSPEFEEFWEAFPQWRGSKFQAWQAWSERIGAVGAESLLVAARTYTAERAGKDPQYTKRAAAWLGAHMDEDWLTPPADASMLPPGSVSPFEREMFGVWA